MSLFSALFGGGEPNAELVELMTRLARQPTPELEGEFFRELAACSLRIAVPGARAQGLPEGPAVAGPDGTKVRFVGTLDPQGRRALPAFTGPKTVLRWRQEGCDTIETAFREVCSLALSAKMESVMIDPGSPYCSLILKESLEAFAQGQVPLAAGLGRPESVDCASIVLSRCPQPPPQALCDALREEAGAHAAIRRAYLVAAAIGGQVPRPVVALELDEGADLDAVIPPFASGATVRLGGRPIPDVLPLANAGLKSRAREDGLLVYARDVGD